MDNIIYWFSGGLFYPSNEEYRQIPEGAINVSAEEFSKAMSRQPGETFTVDNDGMVTIVPVPELSHEQLVAQAELQRRALIDVAMQSISVVQLKLQAGRKLTTSETEQINATLDYIDAVTATNTSTAPDVNWPPQP
ncbi:TPA: tail fiber assembly protein [Escherichia coli]|nr:tail fiber assembly protein [Escherichia coli]EFH2872184.1 phage tail protein [Escherichia coli]EFH7367305.1 phage tail protein [Escherichia coli]EGI7150961.1 tail fiber assembly protein [Escherichia coli]EHW7469786.1 tail fiber assembly protein [Escherichia coli]EHX8040557.1 tail fiber assembly protein [Escherichia coli]